MNKKIMNQIGIGILIMIIVSVVLVTTDIVSGKYLDTIITITGCIIGLILFFNIRKEKITHDIVSQLIKQPLHKICVVAKIS